ncbi:MAG: NAD(P)-dependent oxidoreductase [Terriglobia bacterium]
MNASASETGLKVVVFGATGNLGRRLVEAGIDKGLSVTAFVRNGGKLAEQQGSDNMKRISVVEGDALDPGAVAAAMQGQAAAVNAAGNVRDGDSFHKTCRTITEAAEAALEPPKRLWLLGGAAALTIADTNLTGLDLPFMPPMFKNHGRNLELLRQSGLDWSFMCPGPMVPVEKLPKEMAPIVSLEVLPILPGKLAKLAPRIGLSLFFVWNVTKMIVSFEEVAGVIMSNLRGGSPFSRKRVGVAVARLN